MSIPSIDFKSQKVTSVTRGLVITNANLIATVYEMYDVLSQLEESVCYWSEYDVPIGIVDKIKNVLAKARGKV